MVVLIGFTSQGDNRGDAVLMASQLNQWLQLRQTQVHTPPSSPLPSLRLLCGGKF